MYTCNVGYQLQGRAELTCDLDERWDGPPPKCVRKYQMGEEKNISSRVGIKIIISSSSTRTKYPPCHLYRTKFTAPRPRDVAIRYHPENDFGTKQMKVPVVKNALDISSNRKMQIILRYLLYNVLSCISGTNHLCCKRT